MSRPQSFVLCAIGFGLAIIGVMMAVMADTPADRMMGAVCAVFFGACGLVGLHELFPARLPAEGPDGRIVIRPSRSRAGVFAFGGLAFVLTGALMVHNLWPLGVSFRLLIGLVAIPFGLTVLAVAGYQLIAARPLYILDRHGAESLTQVKWRLAWRDISEIGISSMGPSRWIDIVPEPHVPDPPGWATSVNRHVRQSPYAIASGTSGVDFNALADTVLALWETHRGPPSGS